MWILEEVKEAFMSENDHLFTEIKTDQGRRDLRETPSTIPVHPATEIKPEAANPTPSFDDVRSLEQAASPQIRNDLTYSCLLIPRFNDHYLTGDITEFLAEWMRQVCISYGWRLDAIIVRPGYLQWVMTVPLNSNPAQFMRIIRRHTSQKIFDDFPRYKQLNMSGDFWSPGFYVTPGDQLLSLEAISSFTQMTRRQQGIYFSP
jgi:REP element-mobilizing transposase RayT